MTQDTPYAGVRQVDDAAGQAVLDVLTETFLSDPVARQLVPSQWLALTTDRAPDAAHPDAPEVVRASWRAGSFPATRRAPQTWCAAHSCRGAADRVEGGSLR
ncbi:hypothetical protein ACQEVC_25265 [Plantactinospora sp. CA-294935]|uniref:hypothetical protein n=1 Tax=Plantactinospora sp. CA-294935 TaxID=3240012 RepID=UPI003D8D4C95